MEKFLEGRKTYCGIAIVLLGAVFQIFKINITTEELQPVINNFIEVVGALIAMYGRIATKKGDV